MVHVERIVRCVKTFSRAFSIGQRLPAKALPARPKILESEISEAFLKGTGPGGQKINKTSSAVQLKHLPTGIVVKCQATRSREQNRKDARKLLAEKLDQLQNGEESRMAMKARIAQKKRASRLKKSRRKYRSLEAKAKKGSEDDQEPEREEDALDHDHDELVPEQEAVREEAIPHGATTTRQIMKSDKLLINRESPKAKETSEPSDR